MQKNLSILFLISALFMLIIGAIAGILISINYISPEFLQDIIPFNQLRPIHTTSVISWIVIAATGGIYYYLSSEFTVFSTRLLTTHYLIFAFTFIGILVNLFAGNMGGREYLVFPPVFILPILIGWMIFGWNYYKTIYSKAKNWPVYYWMWGTGIVFMVFHLCEANFWLLDHFRSDFIRDMTVQWKSYGSFVGSWNMLIYGTAIYLMAKIKGDTNYGRGKLPFFFYFLGLSNLMFGWAHHTYVLPTLPWVRYVAYGISMTEWIIFIRMIYLWARSVDKPQIKKYKLAYQFLIASDVWVFLNLFMALLMSIPYLNSFTHGTHITVAHSMGTTIGINTMILLGSICYILYERKIVLNHKTITRLFIMLNVSLFSFWIFLIVMGIRKAIWMTSTNGESIQTLHHESHNLYFGFVVSGILLGLTLSILAFHFLRSFKGNLYYLILPKKIQEEWDRIYGEVNED